MWEDCLQTALKGVLVIMVRIMVIKVIFLVIMVRIMFIKLIVLVITVRNHNHVHQSHCPGHHGQ